MENKQQMFLRAVKSSKKLKLEDKLIHNQDNIKESSEEQSQRSRNLLIRLFRDFMQKKLLVPTDSLT